MASASEIQDVNTGHRPHTTDGRHGGTAADQRERYLDERPAMVCSDVNFRFRFFYSFRRPIIIVLLVKCSLISDSA